MRRLALIAAAGLLLPCHLSAAPEGNVARFPAHRVDIRVTIADEERASVDEEYLLTGNVTDPVFEFLGSPCGGVGPVSAAADDRETSAPSVVTRGPWRALRYDGSSGARTWRIHYEVTLAGNEVDVPIVMPASALESEPGGRGARVGITVRWTGAPGAARVVMPRLVARSADDVWDATLPAMPSAIRMRVPGTAGTCRSADAGDAGGLEWRFAVFALTMMLWAAAYLTWTGRSWSAHS